MKKVSLVVLALATALATAPAAMADSFNFTFTGVGITGGGTMVGTDLGSGNFDINGGVISFTIDSVVTAATVIPNPTPGVLNTSANSAFNFDDILTPGLAPFYLLDTPDSTGATGGLLFQLAGGEQLEIWFGGTTDMWEVYNPATDTFLFGGNGEQGQLYLTPEPSSLLLLGTGLLSMAGFLFWKSKPSMIQTA